MHIGPALSFLAGMYGVKQVGAGTAYSIPRQGTKVPNGQRLFGRFAQKQIAHGNMDGVGQCLHLLECRLSLTHLPIYQFLELAGQVLLRKAGSLPCPSEEAWVNRGSSHATFLDNSFVVPTRRSPDINFGSNASRCAMRVNDSSALIRSDANSGRIKLENVWRID